ncbi:MAG: cysteine desulfurase family protein [Candidatus Hadarchaeaceae archaeon]
MKVYLDNGTTTPVAKEVVEAMLPYFTERFGHPIFIYSLGQDAADVVESSQATIARTINAKPSEIIFTSSATEANDLAIRGVVYANRKRGDHIITTKIENPSVLRVCEELEKEGFKVDYLPVDTQGFVDLGKLEKTITKRTILVSVGHVSDEIGTIEPIEQIGKLLREQKNKIFFHVNAAAAYARVPIDVNRMGIDLMSLSAHKIHGPKGVGSLYLRENTPIEPISYGYISLFTLKPGTENIPGIAGFGRAAELAFDGFEKYVENMRKLRDKLMAGIEERVPHVLLHGPRGDKRSPTNVNYSFKGVEGESVLLHLDLNGISVATGSACSTRKLEPSHVLTAIGVKPEVAHGAIRFTLSRYNTTEEIDYVLEMVPRVIENLRKISPVKPEEL